MDKNKLIDAYTAIRKDNQSVPDDVLDYMYQAALKHEWFKHESLDLRNAVTVSNRTNLKIDKVNTELKAMVNEFIKLQKENYGCGMDTHLALIDLVIKTPTQCLADYRNSVIDECIAITERNIIVGDWRKHMQSMLNKLKKGDE